MSTTKISLTIVLLLSLLTVWGCQSSAQLPSEKKDVTEKSSPTSE
jgi:hypothetical protein